MRNLGRGGFGPGHLALGLAMAALGARGLAMGEFASVWQRIPIEHLPARAFFAYATATVELVAGLALLLPRSVRLAAPTLLVFTLLWTLLLQLPAVLYRPTVEATWLGLSEVTVILAGCWAVFAQRASGRTRERIGWLTGAAGIRGARVLLALSLPGIGLSHFFYPNETASLVPVWMPYPVFWGYLTGACSLAAAAAILVGAWPALAARLEALMLWVITLLVWAPGLASPTDESVTPFLVSALIASGAWAVADTWREGARVT